MSHLTYLEASFIGLLQGVTELFPVSSLGHSVLIPAFLGGQWARDLDVSTKESPYLAFIVGLHVVTAAQRPAWMIILAAFPVCAAASLLARPFRVLLGKPNPASICVTANSPL